MGARNCKAKAAAVHAKTQPHKQNKEVIKDGIKDDLVYYATPLSIGKSNIFGEMVFVIPKNTPIPTKKFEWGSTTTFDDQELMTISIYQGERKRASDNKLLGTLIVEGIPPAPRGGPTVTVCFDVDAKGNLNLSAHDRSTGKKLASKSIPGVGVRGELLSAEEVEKMAEKHKSEEDEEHLKKGSVMKATKEYGIVTREFMGY